MPELRLHHIRRTFGTDPAVVALDDVSVTIAQGDFVAIEGPSGSGKSTLLNQLALIDKPTAGAYFIDGKLATADERTRARVRSEIFGFIFQSFHLIARRTASENVGLGLLYRGVPRVERRFLAEQALAEVGLRARTNTQARKLSGGEQQRVAIARAMLGGAAVLIADEPTGNLDSSTGADILDQLSALNARGTSVIIVTHDPAVAARAHSRLRIKDGKVVKSHGATASSLSTVKQAPGTPSMLRYADAFSEAWHATRSRPGRCTLLVAALAIAVALIVFTFGLSETASAQVTQRFDAERSRQVDIRVPQDDATGRSGVPRDIESRLAQVHGILRSGVYQVHDQVTAKVPGEPSVSIPFSGISRGLVRAVGASVEWAKGHRHVLGNRELLVGSAAAADLRLGPLDLDPVVEVDGADYGVVGIVVDGGRVPALAGQLSADWGEASGPRGPISWVYVTTVRGAAAQVARQAPIAIDPVRAGLIDVTAPPDINTLRNGIQRDVRSALIALTAVAFVAALLGAMSTMLIGVIERIGEFGLRRAIGARPIHIIEQTFAEGVIVGMFGGLAGLFTGLGALLTVTVAHGWVPVFDARWLPFAVVGGVLAGVLSGLPASLRAAGIQPIDALRR